MARRKKHEEHENLERWLVSYADFITLLFAFFVVMYSISSVNEGKYRVLSDSMVKAFSNPAGIKPIKIGDPIKAPISEIDRNNAQASRTQPFTPMPPPDAAKDKEKEEQARAEAVQAQQLNAVADELDVGLKSMIDKNLIKVNRDKKWVEVEMNTSILYSSGSAAVQEAALPVLRTLAKILKGKSYNIQVEGFTDNVPIKTENFPSNWELSASRAASVVHVFTDEGVAPERMSAIGFGEYRPVADNASEEGRNKNRRVTVVVLPPGKTPRDAAQEARVIKKETAAVKDATPGSAAEFNFGE